MVATTRLYQNDSLLLQFDAEVCGTETFQDKPALQLNQTAFYPEGGGQPGDHGEIRLADQQLRVVDVQVDNTGTIHHLLKAPAMLEPGTAISGIVDEARRRDFMSQHTGQHMLSALIDQTLDAPTVSARLGSKHGTIDVEADPARFTDTSIAQLEQHLQQLVLENRPIHIRYPRAEDLASLGLRRAPKVSEGIRIIDVEGFDKTPCGGTHCAMTGQVGPVKILGRERYKGLTRLSFIAGQRAMDYLFQQQRLLAQVTQTMGCAPEELAGHLDRMRGEIKQQGQQLGQLRSKLIAIEAAEILQGIEAGEEPRLVLFRENEAYRASRQLALALVAHPTMVTLVASREQADADWRVIVARGNQSTFDCGAWFRGPGKAHGARGGGKPDRAEGILASTVDPQNVKLDLP